MQELLEKALHAAEQNMTDVIDLWANGRTSQLVLGEALRDMKNDGLKLVKAARKALVAAPPAALGAGEAWVVLRDKLACAVDEWECDRECNLHADDREQLLETLATWLLPCAS